MLRCQNIEPLRVDYDFLMDLRVDYAFKRLFSKGSTRPLISLLNAIFANKKIPRNIKSIAIKNPYMDKESGEDKLSILDVRAELDDGAAVLIEMHMYGLGELKAKTIRSWARAFGEELETGKDYAEQPPAIAIAFTNGQIEPIEKPRDTSMSKPKIHRLCKIMDCEDFTLFTDSMELHYIDMKAFVSAVNEAGTFSTGDTGEVMFAKWLSLITQKEITNKAIIENASKDEEEIQMAISALAKQSEDKIARQAYQRRKDEIFYYNKNMREREEYKRRAEQAEAKIAELAKQSEDTIADQAKLIAQLKARLGEE